MSYGLYISDGKNGSVITNSDTIFNEEYDFGFSEESLSAGASRTIQTKGAGNSALIGVSLESSDNNLDNLTVTRDLTTDTLTITNTGNTDIPVISAKIFRFQ
jgi:hypothetical protein